MADHRVRDAIAIIFLVVFVSLAVHGYTNPSCNATNDFSTLGSLNLGSPPAALELFNSTWRSEASVSYQSTLTQIVPNTVTGYLDISAQMRNLSLQWLQNPPSWIKEGTTAALNATFLSLLSRITSSGSATQAVGLIQNFAASIAGYNLAALNFVSFNGVSAFQSYLETGNVNLGLCQTFPAQVAQLYKMSFESSVPIDLRAQYFGQAAAITAVMVLLGGTDGFSAKFSDALDTVGLSEAWTTIKPYLYDIGTKVSADASAAVLSILQAVASHFPQDSVWATGLTASRINAMVETIQLDGVSNDIIENDIQKLVQASGHISGEDDIATDADELSYVDGGGIQLQIRSNNHMVIYDDGTGDTASMTVAFLQQEIPGFNPRGPDFIAVYYHEADVTVYHYFPPRTNPTQTTWMPVAPQQFASPGDVVTVSFSLLTEDQFFKDALPIDFINDARENWMGDFGGLSSYSLSGDSIQLAFSDYPEVDGIPTNFVVQGTVTPLQWSNGDTYATISIPNVVNDPRTLKLTFDGYGDSTLSVNSGTNFNKVLFVSSDGVRLRIVYDSGGGNPTVATIYLQDPSTLYTLGDMAPGNDYGVPSVSEAYQIQQVTLNRQLEVAMLNNADPYDLARLGAEIAYTVEVQKFDLTNMRLNEPSVGGADLATSDGSVEVQARFLNMGNPSSGTVSSVLQSNLNQMVGKITTFMQTPAGSKVQVGYAILSYYTTMNGIQTIILVVPRVAG